MLPNESDLSTQFSVSRTALREAIKVLAAKGLVESRPKTGTRVRPRGEWNMLDPDLLAWQFATQPMEQLAKDLFEIRQIIEPAAAAMAAERADEDQRKAISGAFADMEAAPDGDASVEPDLRFHQSILAASNNEFLQPLGALIETAMASSFRITNNDLGRCRCRCRSTARCATPSWRRSRRRHARRCGSCWRTRRRTCAAPCQTSNRNPDHSLANKDSSQWLTTPAQQQQQETLPLLPLVRHP